MRRSLVFISSTVYDLLDERKAIYDMLEDSGYIPTANEYANFDLADGKSHSYRICLDNVEKSDIVVAILGHRLGGVVFGKGYSITFQEILHAWRKNKIVYIFCKQSVADERHLFKQVLKHFPSKEEAFRSIKTSLKSDSYMIFDNIDRITKSGKHNWISFYTDKDDLLNKVRGKLIAYSLDKLEAESVNYTGVIDMLRRGTDLRIELYDNTYDENRDKSAEVLKILSSFVDYDKKAYASITPSTLDKLKRYYSDNTDYANTKGMESAELATAKDTKIFYGFDTQMELNSPNIWMKDRSFKRYLLFTGKCARKERNKHYRVFLFDTGRFILDNALSIYNTVSTHLDYGITPVLTTYSNILHNIPFDLVNCNALLGERVLVVMLPVGVTMLFTKHSNRNKLRLYDESFEHILSLATKSRGALRIDRHIAYRDFAALIRGFEF
ncbi:MAG TPA: DUF4062 domain-containing protein [Chthoniobacterales bacterium]|nr:DUF4062 domain-containing protein [Chthoniobacterales bacterium]